MNDRDLKSRLIAADADAHLDHTFSPNLAQEVWDEHARRASRRQTRLTILTLFLLSAALTPFLLAPSFKPLTPGTTAYANTQPDPLPDISLVRQDLKQIKSLIAKIDALKTSTRPARTLYVSHQTDPIQQQLSASSLILLNRTKRRYQNTDRPTDHLAISDLQWIIKNHKNSREASRAKTQLQLLKNPQ